MFKLVRRLLAGIAIIIAIAIVGGAYAVSRIPDPETGLRADGSVAFVPDGASIYDSEIGDTVLINDDSKLDHLASAFAADVYPDYYRVIGTCTSAHENRGDGIAYGDLDDLGRATGAAGWISGEMRAMVRSLDRDGENLPDPVGWPDKNPQTTIKGAQGRRDYHGYLWNRSHLIAFSLGGTNQVNNLVCGTRTQNVGDNITPGGMAYTETLARDWLDANPDGRLWYAVTPIYHDDELIPRAIVVDIKTDDGSIDQKVMVYNAANGFDINYYNGATEPTAPFS